MNNLASRSKAIAAAALFLAALSPAAAQQAPARGGTLTFIVQPEPPGLLGQLNTATPVTLVSTKIHDGLLSLDSNRRLVPALALSYEMSADGKTIALALRRNVKWHDGKDFTSADVKYTLEEVIKKYHPRGRSLLATLDAVDTPDSHTAILRFNRPALYIPSTLTYIDMPIMPKHVYEGTDPRTNPAGNAPIGTGPFKFVEWKKGISVTLERNNDYWDAGKPYLDKMVIRFIPDPATRAVALESGEADIAGANPIPLTDVARFRAMKNVEVRTDGYEAFGSIMHFEFNTRVSQFNDVRVRQALSHAINRQFVVDHIWGGLGSPATSNVPRVHGEFFAPDVPKYEYNKALAEKLLDEAGFKRGSNRFRFRITHDTLPLDENYRRLALYLKQAFSEIGVEVDVRSQDLAGWLKRVYTDNDYQTSSYIISGMTDPTIGLQRLYWSKNIIKGAPYSNGSGYNNPKVDDLLVGAQFSADPAERVKLWREFQHITMRELPIIPIMNVNYVTVINKRVKGITATGFGPYANFAELYIGAP
jgi:peptide/nickel transport system substrate-binding protein